MSKFCPKCQHELIDNYCYNCDKDMTKEIEKEEKEQEERDSKKKEEREKNGRRINEISFLLAIGCIFAFYPIGAILALIFGEDMLKIVGLVLGILVFVVYLIYVFSVKGEEVKRISEKTYRTTKAIIIFMAFVGVIWMFVDIGFEQVDNTDNRPRKYINCENKSDTYNKCSWSYSENRCVCKRR